MPTVIEIIAEHLTANGYDGLVNDGLECGCELGELESCDGLKSDCQPAYRGASLNAEDDWMMYASKDAAASSLQEAA